MAYEARLRYGDPATVFHTPGSNVVAGQVVVLNDVPLVAHRDITAGDKGNLAAGGGVYECTAELAINPGETVYWDDTSNKVDKTNTNKKFGFAVSASTADGDKIDVFHRPG